MRTCEVTVWWGYLDGAGDRYRFARLLSADERSRAAAFRFPRDRSRFIAARALMRNVLGGHVGVDPKRLEFAYGEHGKPRLAHDTDLHFNLSHSHGVMALALCEGREIGIDLEARREGPASEVLAQRYLPPRVAAEIERQAAGDERLSAFFRAWVRQEAYAKGRGVGLEAIGEDPEDWSITDLELLDGYAAALAAEGTAPLRVTLRPLARSG
jgi:4'-phosphopantetheinyl transferase